MNDGFSLLGDSDTQTLWLDVNSFTKSHFLANALTSQNNLYYYCRLLTTEDNFSTALGVVKFQDSNRD